MKRVWVIIGAGVGEALKSSHLAEFDEVQLIEPVPVLATTLKDKFGSTPNVTIINAAVVANEAHVQDFRINTPMVWSSYSEPQDIRKRYPGFEEVERVQVPQLTVGKLTSGLGECQLTVELNCCGYEVPLLTQLLESVRESVELVCVEVVLGQQDFTDSATVSALAEVFADTAYRRTSERTEGWSTRVCYEFSIAEELARLRTLETELADALMANANVSRELEAQTAAYAGLREQLDKTTAAKAAAEKRINELEEHQEILKTALDGVNSSSGEVTSALKTLEDRLTWQVKRYTINSAKQIESFLSVRDYLSSGRVGYDFHGWPISSELALMLLGMLHKHHYDCIIEFGSGTSTAMFAEALLKKAELIADSDSLSAIEGPGRKSRSKEVTGFAPSEHDVPRRILSFEHNQKYFNLTDELLESKGFRGIVDLVYAPLVPADVEGKDFLYYSCDKKLSALADSLSADSARLLVLVDGPPQQTGKLARLPALPKLLEYLPAFKMDIVLDDFGRALENEIVNEWIAMLDARSIAYEGEVIESETGAHILRINGAAES